MRLYILVEDGKSFSKILPHWLKIIIPSYHRAKTVDEMSGNSYVLFSGKGYPRLLGIDRRSNEKNVLGLAIETINMYNELTLTLTLTCLLFALMAMIWA